MNKKGEEFGGDVIYENLGYIIFTTLFFITMLAYVGGLQDGAAVYEGFYAKEIANVVNTVEHGSEVCLDVTKATEIASRRKKSVGSIFNFNNVNNEIVVSLRQNGGSAYMFFNEVDVVDWNVKLLSGIGGESQLCFFVKEPPKTNGGVNE